jgi:hypothetical protein
VFGFNISDKFSFFAKQPNHSSSTSLQLANNFAEDGLRFSMSLTFKPFSNRLLVRHSSSLAQSPQILVIPTQSFYSGIKITSYGRGLTATLSSLRSCVSTSVESAKVCPSRQLIVISGVCEDDITTVRVSCFEPVANINFECQPLSFEGNTLHCAPTIRLLGTFVLCS